MRTKLLTFFVCLMFASFSACGPGEGGPDSKKDKPSGDQPSTSAGIEKEQVDKPGDDWGTITGKVVLMGEVPKPRREQAKQHEECSLPTDDKFVTVQKVETGENNALKEVFVFVEDVSKVLTPELPPKTVEIDQKGCKFNPDTVLIRKGGKLVVKNSDPTSHNFKCEGENPLGISENINQDKGAKDEITPKKVEFATFKCDVHPWMGGMLRVADHHAYALTGDDGSFSFQLPSGTHTLKIRHQTMDEAKTVEVEVKAGEEKEKTIELNLSG